MPPADSFNQFNRGHRRLKVEPRFFDDLVNGKKSFEVRLDDRNFKFGDILHLGSGAVPGCQAKAVSPAGGHPADQLHPEGRPLRHRAG